MRYVGALLSHIGFPTQRSEQAARFSGPNSEAAELIWALEVSPTESSVLPTSPDPRPARTGPRRMTIVSVTVGAGPWWRAS